MITCIHYPMAVIYMRRNDIIAELVNARLEKGISQAALARLVNTHRSNICRIESGSQNITVDMLIKISRALGKEVDLSLKDITNQDNNLYSLRLYNTNLITFTMEVKGLSGLVTEIQSVDETKKHLFPLDLECSNKGILKWLERRVVPKNRRFVEEILESYGLSQNDTKGIIDICKGLSLNDSYWVVPVDFNGSFEEYNLFENQFSELLGLVAYTGAGQGRLQISTSPEFTTNGMLPKAWRFIDNDGIYLYKGGTSGASNTGREPYCEYYASQIAETMGLNAVHYDLENWKGITASKCALFTDINTSFVPIGRVTQIDNLQDCLNYYHSQGQAFSEQLHSMLIFDALIYNEDRHFGNFGLLRDNRTGKIISPAPIFDNGLSLLCFAGIDTVKDFKKMQTYAKNRTNPYGLPYEEICAAVMGQKQKEQLRHMIGFTFKRHPSINFTEEHLRNLEKVLELRVRELLTIPINKSILH